MGHTDKVTGYIEGVGGWRGKRLRQLRQLINEVAPQLTEDFKWGVPVWTYNGLVVAVSAFKDHVKINFLKGASLDVPPGTFNSGLDSKMHRSINFTESDELDTAAIGKLVKAAAARNNG